MHCFIHPRLSLGKFSTCHFSHLKGIISSLQLITLNYKVSARKKKIGTIKRNLIMVEKHIQT